MIKDYLKIMWNDAKRPLLDGSIITLCFALYIYWCYFVIEWISSYWSNWNDLVIIIIILVLLAPLTLMPIYEWHKSIKKRVYLNKEK